MKEGDLDNESEDSEFEMEMVTKMRHSKMICDVVGNPAKGAPDEPIGYLASVPKANTTACSSQEQDAIDFAVVQCKYHQKHLPLNFAERIRANNAIEK
jgi:hypothetical protein